ncbi:MAG: glycosyltransferase family 1 protein [Desulfobacterales bacterium]|nr:glycosyltransferase family 1 protein [Desulfobacterales bacterium]
MKIILTTYGSRGDVQPILALSLALKKAGHNVTLCAPPENKEWIENYQCPFHPLGDNLKEAMEKIPPIHTIKATFAFMSLWRKALSDQFDQLPEIIKGADLVIGSGLTLGVPSVAEQFKIPFCLLVVCPQSLPSAYYPPSQFHNHNLKKIVNRILWWYCNKIDNLTYKGIINKGRKSIGLTPIKDLYKHFLGHKIILASDIHLGVCPSDVKQDYIQIGHFPLKQEGGLGKELEDFLYSGFPPIYFGIGSMPNQDPKLTTQIVIEAARKNGQRLILSSGWAGLGKSEKNDDFFVVGSVPHDLLFPKVSMVIHHGGHGTTATAARAGVPQIIVPQILDQHYWANQIHIAGLGPKPINRLKLTVDSLSSAINTCITDQIMRDKAINTGRLLISQNSLEKAVKFIESNFKKGV